MKPNLIIVGVLACVGANIAKIGHRKAKTKRRLQLCSSTQDGTAKSAILLTLHFSSTIPKHLIACSFSIPNFHGGPHDDPTLEWCAAACAIGRGRTEPAQTRSGKSTPAQRLSDTRASCPAQ